MAQVELIMPKMGESIMEATILKWLKSEGESVEMDESVLEIATDKVDSEVPSPVAGKIIKILYEVDDVVEVDKVIAIIETDANATASTSPVKTEELKVDPVKKAVETPKTESVSAEKTSSSGRFYSPLVRNIAKKEGLSMDELDSIAGSGKDGRVNKSDILNYLNSKGTSSTTSVNVEETKKTPVVSTPSTTKSNYSGENVEIIEMDRMRRLIADHMVMSKQTSPHVTSYVEADVTNIVNWRNRVKEDFLSKHGEKITFTPIFIEAVAKAISDFPMVNISVEGTNIIRKKDINIGMATALPSGNLIVPVIKNADTLNLTGITKKVNSLANSARNNKLSPDDIQGGTFTLTNVGTFGNVMGTPIINQPQVAILAVGAIRKMPAVIETEYGDVIAIRQKMFLSLAYDHRVVDGALGGSFLRKIADYLESFDHTQTI